MIDHTNILADSGLLVTLIPFGVVVLGFITFEVAMAVTISTLPRSRLRHKWTPQEQRRVLRVFATVFCAWPITALLVVAHMYLPLFAALLADAVVLGIVVLLVRWLIRARRQRQLILAGHCENCFYDLRASQDSDHCPECGVDLAEHPSRVVSVQTHS